MTMALKIIGALVLVLVVLTGGVILALPYLASTDLVKDKVAGLVEQKTGRKLTIGGDTSFALFPDIAVVLNKISLSNPPGMNNAPLVKMSSLQANLKLMPLFAGKAVIDSVTLIKPQFNLLVDKKGRRNWDFDTAAKKPDSSASSKVNGKALSLGIITIKNGFVRYHDMVGKVDEKIEAVNIEIAQRPSDRSIKSKGNLRWHNEILNISTRIASPDNLLAGKPSVVRVDLGSRFTDSRYDGTLDPGKNPGIDGQLVSDTPSLRKLAAFLGHDLPAGTGFGKLKIKSKISANAKRVAFTTSQFLFDNMDLKAKGEIKLDGPRPFVKANIDADRLDLNAYRGSSKRGGAPSGSPKSAANPQVDLSGLKALDGVFVIKTNEILYQKARLGKGRFKLILKNGRANASIESLNLYRGTATGKIVLDGSGSRSFVGGKLSLKNILTGALLRDVGGFDKLAGKGTIDADFTTRGNSVRALKRSLRGTTKMKLVKGRIEGFDLARYVSDLTGNEVPGSDTGRKGKKYTAYDEMSALININKGIARNKNFLLKGKFFRVRAAGTVDIVKEDLRLRVAPFLFSGDWNFAPPLRVTGNWSKPKISLDALAFLGGGGTAFRSLTGILQGKKTDFGSVLKNRGLKSEKEIENYLAGKKIDVSNEQPANDNTVKPDAGAAPDAATSPATATNSESTPATGLLDGANKKSPKANDLLKKLFP